jgi:hypothetical protein
MHQFLKFILEMKLYMFRTVPLSIITSFSLYTQQWYMSYRFFYIIRKYVLPTWSEHNYIFSHRIVHWVYNYMFRLCIGPLVTASRIRLTIILLMWRIGWAPSSIPIYIQQDATLHSLFISGNCSTSFGWYFHPSSGAYYNYLTSNYTICAWGTVGGTRSRLTLVGGMALDCYGTVFIYYCISILRGASRK